MKNNYISKCLMYMTITITIMLTILICFFYNYFRNMYVSQLYNYEDSINYKISENINIYLTETQNQLENISININLLNYINETPKHSEDEITKYLNSNFFINENNNLYKFIYEKKVVDRQMLLRTTVDNDVKGIYKYTFIIKTPIIDPITGYNYGTLNFVANEKLLNNLYNFNNRLNEKFYIVDDNNTIISSTNKSDIDMNITDFITADNDVSYFRNNLNYNNWYIISLVKNVEKSEQIKDMNFFTISIFVLCVIIIFLINIYFNKKMSKPIDYICDTLAEISKGDLDIHFEFEEENEFSRIGDNFNYMLTYIKSLIESVKKEEALKKETEINFLRSQINPHFIYNTLNSVRFYINLQKTEEASEMLILFSRLLRQVSSNSTVEIAIKDELDILYSYIDLQHLRYGDDFHVNINIDESLLDKKIPFFILQPIVENAIFYNIELENTTIINIIINIINDTLVITINDNGIGIDEDILYGILEKTNESIGIRNVHNRIKLLYGKAYGIDITSKVNNGTSVKLVLPIIDRG